MIHILSYIPAEDLSCSITLLSKTFFQLCSGLLKNKLFVRKKQGEEDVFSKSVTSLTRAKEVTDKVEELYVDSSKGICRYADFEFTISWMIQSEMESESLQCELSMNISGALQML